MLVPMIFYLLTLQKALNRCSPECRAMNPGMVWLMLIPLFNMVWHFFIVMNMAKSLGCEFQKRGIAEDPKPGQTLGLVMCILGDQHHPCWDPLLAGRPDLLDYLLGQDRRLLQQDCCAAGYLRRLESETAVRPARARLHRLHAAGADGRDARRASRHPFPNASSARISRPRLC